MTEDMIFADLTLRGWNLCGDYMYRRISSAKVAVCMRSRLDEKYTTTTIPYSPEEETRNADQADEGWSAGEHALTDAHRATLEYDHRGQDT